MVGQGINMLDGLTPTASPPGVPDGQKVITSPEPPPGAELRDDEARVYDYLCRYLREAEVEHLTSGMALMVAARTFCDWLRAYEQCNREGRTQTSPKGWVGPTPWAEDEKRLKMEVGQWLAKLAGTIPSLTRVRKDLGAGAAQDDLFAELLEHARGSPGARPAP